MINKLKSIYKLFSVKVTIIMCILMIACSLIWTITMFVNMRTNAINTLVKDEESFIDKTNSNINNIQEVCNMSLQIVASLDSVIDYIDMVRVGNDLNAQEKIDFYNNDITAISNITNLNPYLYQIRLYVLSNQITEKEPCLYNIVRMGNMAWAGNRTDGKWLFDYNDNVFAAGNVNKRLAGVTNTIQNKDGDALAVIEVATELSSLFPEIFASTNSSWACFITWDGTLHCDDNTRYKPKNMSEITRLANTTRDTNIITTKIDGEEVVLSAIYVDSLNGTYIHMNKLNTYVTDYFQSQRSYIFILVFSLILSLVLMAFITTNMFKRFNTITESIRHIVKGQTDLRLTVEGEDQISDMAMQFNHMLDILEKLNEENTTRQLIIKNTEIKSMQNQINAHFMYNVLESIKMMAEIKGEYDISDAVTSLGEMFRYSVKWTSGKVALKEEIKYIRNYIALMNLRTDHEIVLSLRVPDDLMEYKIPKMSLQPIVENSVMHGNEGIDTDISIYLKVFIIDKIMHLEISDTGRGMSSVELHYIREKLKGEIKLDESTVHGLALKNVQNRIKLYYGEKYGLEVYSEEGLYTKVVILMPYEESEGLINE